MQAATTIEQLGDVWVATSNGEIDAFSAPSLREDLRHLIEELGARSLVIDLSAVTFLDSSGLGAVVGALRRLNERDGELRIVQPRSAASRISSTPVWTACSTSTPIGKRQSAQRSREAEAGAGAGVARPDLDISATALMIARPIPSSSREDASHSSTAVASNPGPSSSTTTSMTSSPRRLR